jgi:hypothetical protein
MACDATAPSARIERVWVALSARVRVLIFRQFMLQVSARRSRSLSGNFGRNSGSNSGRSSGP